MVRSRHVLPILASIVLTVLVAGHAAAQEVVADSVDAPADTIDPAYPTPIIDPRITLLGDTLVMADSLLPHFAELREIYPDSVVDPYTAHRPGQRPAWVLSGDEILGRGIQSLLDVLESENLVLGQDIGGGGVATFIGSPWGTGSNVQVLVDGVPVGSPLAVNWDLRRIPAEAIARVAWYPGPQVASWGGAGTGGVLSITTRRSIAPAARSLLAFGVGSFDTEKFAGYLGRPVTSRGDVFVAANFDATDGFLRTGDFTRNQLVAKAGWRLGDRQRIEIARFSDGFTGDAASLAVNGSQDKDAVLLHAFYGGGLGPFEARVHGYRENVDLTTNFEFLETPGLFGESERTGYRAELDLAVGPVVGWVGGGWEEAEASSFHPAFSRIDGSNLLEEPDEPGGPAIENPRRRTEWAGGVGFGRPGGLVAANAAVRRLGFGDAAESGTAWSADVLARPLEGLTVRGTAGRSVRSPGVLAQSVLVPFADQGIEIHPGRAAEPEVLETWTAYGGEVSWSRPAWRIAARAYRADGDNAFLWLPPTAWLYFDRANLSAVRLGEPGFNTFDVVDMSARGVEGEIVLPLPWGLRGRLEVRRLELTGGLTGEQVPYVPRTQALGQLRYARRFFPSRDMLVEARLTGRYSGERTSLSDEVLSDYLVGDALAQVTIINFTIWLSVKNFAGQLIRTEESFPLPGAEFFFGINWRFRN